MKLFEKFFMLNKEQKLLFIEALVLLWYSKILLIILPYKKCTGLLIPFEKLKVRPDSLFLIEIRNAASRANKFAVWKNVCLVKSFTARFMLQRRGIASVMYLGLQIDKESEKS